MVILFFVSGNSLTSRSFQRYYSRSINHGRNTSIQASKFTVSQVYSFNSMPRNPHIRTSMFYVSTRPDVRMSGHPDILSSSRLPIHASERPNVRMPAHPYVQTSAHPYIRTSARPHVRMSARLHVCTSARPHVRTSARLHVRTPYARRTARPRARRSVRPYICTSAYIPRTTLYCRGTSVISLRAGHSFIYNQTQTSVLIQFVFKIHSSSSLHLHLPHRMRTLHARPPSPFHVPHFPSCLCPCLQATRDLPTSLRTIT